MARFLICTIPIAGHVSPGKALAHALIERGHEVTWYTGEFFREIVKSTGAKFIPISSWMDYSSPVNVPPQLSDQRLRLQGTDRLKFDLTNFFIDVSVGQVKDITHILKSFPADVILTDSFFLGGAWVSEQGGPPWAEFGISTLGMSSQDTAPFGLGLQPDSSFFGGIRNSILNWLFEQFVFKDILKHTNQIRAGLGLLPSSQTFFNAISPYLYLAGTLPDFEYPRRDLPPQVHFVGPLLTSLYVEYVPPAWWADLQAVKQEGKPVVLVTQGTVATDIKNLVLPSLKALAEQDVFVVATTGSIEPQDLQQPIPSNARVEKYVSFADLFSYIDLFISNGGFNGVQMALANGIPVIVAGKTEDKPEICARVEWLGVGINLHSQAPQPNQIRQAVSRVLAESRYKRKAQKFKAKTEQLNGIEIATTLLEQLAQTKRPVIRQQESTWPNRI